jgi:hypothetical protein
MPQSPDPGKPSRPKRKTSAKAPKLDADRLVAELLAAPRFPEGKRRLPLKSLGLRSGAEHLMIGDEDPQEYEGLVNWWIELLDAEGPADQFMASGAAYACWQLRRLHKAIAATRKLALLRSGARDHEGSAREAAALGGRLAENPPEVVGRLRETVAGCRWLGSQWRFFDCMIGEENGLYPSQQLWATQLLGLRETGPHVFRAWLDALMADMPGRKESAVLRAVARAIIAELEAQAERLTSEAEAQWWAMQQARRSPSPEEKVRQRYETMYLRTIRQTIRSIKTFKSPRRRNAARDANSDEPPAAGDTAPDDTAA